MNIVPAAFSLTVPPPPEATLPPRRAGLRNKALWLIGVALLANAGVMLFSHRSVPELILSNPAQAQDATPMLGARGIYMMPAQLGPNTFGLYLMDVDSSTLCVYKANPDTSHFRLMAARSFKYDRFLEDFNNDPLTPKDVQKIVEKQRARTDLKGKDDQPTVDQSPKPDENLPDPPKAPLQ